MKCINFIKTGVILLALSSFNLNAQNVGINSKGNKPSSDAVLDLRTGNLGSALGLLPNEVSLSATNSSSPFSTPDTGLIVYNYKTAGTAPYNVVPGYYYWTGSAWVMMLAPSSGTAGQVLTSNGGGDPSWTTLSATNYWTLSGTNLYNNSGTNVGIGTSSPSAQLDVVGTQQFGAKLETSNIIGTWFQLNNTSTGGIGWNIASTGSSNSEGAGNLIFNATSGDILTLQSSTGYVGIGTSSPTAVLDVFGNQQYEGIFSSYNSTGTWLQINNGAGGTGWNIVSTGSSNGEGAGNLLFNTQSGGDAMTIKSSNGYVGIGTSSPTHLLQVAGTTATTNFEMTSGATSGYVLQSDASGNGTWVSPSAGLGAVRYVGTSYLGITSGAGSVGTSEGTSSNLYNINLGTGAGNSNTSGNYNVAEGYQALNYASTGSNNIAIGDNALYLNNGSYNTAVGDNSADNVTVGSYNTTLGSYSYSGANYGVSIGSYAHTSGSNGVSVGYYAESATNAVSIGTTSQANASGGTAIGMNAYANYTNATAIGNSSNTTNTYATAIGYEATAANYATSLGTQANATNTNSTAIGYEAISNGTDATAIGYQAGASNSNATSLGSNAQALGSNSTAIGNGASAFSSNTMEFGNNSVTQFEFNGAFMPYYSSAFQSGTSGQVLESQGNGVAPQWVTPTSGTVTGSGTATQVAFWSGSSALSSNSNLYWDNTNDRLGIGISSPSASLDVEGSGQYVGNFQSSGTVGAWLNLVNTSTGGTVFNVVSTGSANSEGAGNLLIRDNSGDIMTLQSSTGNVGIGTTSPSAILHTVASGAKTANYYGNILSNTATSSTASITKAALELQSTGNWTGSSASNIGLYVSSTTGGSYNYDAIFNGGGNVGIGIAYPTAILHTVASGAKTANYYGNILTNTATSTTANITKAGLQIQSTGSWTGTSANNIGLYVSSTTGGTNNYDAIFNGGGYVGVGTATPVAPLHVFHYGSGISGTNANTIESYSIFRVDGGTSTNGAIDMGQFATGSYAAWIQASSSLGVNPLSLNPQGGNVGIGTTSPTSILHTVASGAKSANYSGNLLTNIATSSNSSLTKAGLEIQSTGTWNGTSASNIGLYVSSTTGGTNNYDAIFNGGGYVGIGTSAPKSPLTASSSLTGPYNFVASFVNTSNPTADYACVLQIQGGQVTDTYNAQLITFENPNSSTLGSISQNTSSSIAYSTTSDERLKENIKPTTFGLNDLMKIQIKDYTYKADNGKNQQTGYIAQQLYTAFPNAVHVGGDDPKTNPWMVDYGRITPLLVKSIQDQQQIIDEQNKKLDAQQKQIDELKSMVEQMVNSKK